MSRSVTRGDPALGFRFQQLRKAQGATQAQIAAKLGIEQQSLSAIENGKDYPGINVLKATATYFDVSLDYLVTGREIPDHQEAVARNPAEIALLRLYREIAEEDDAQALLRIAVGLARKGGK